MTDIDTLCESTKLRLIANALGLQQCTKTAAGIIPLPGTDNVVAFGPRDWIVKNVGAVLAVEQPGALTTMTGPQLHKVYVASYGGVDEGMVAVANAAIADYVARARLAATTQASTAQAEPGSAQAPEGFALVPLRMTSAMRRATDEEGWQWEDLLAAAESITDEQYDEIVATSSTDAQPPRTKAQIIALANAAGIDTDDEGDIFGSTNGAIFAFVEALGVRAAAEVRAATLEQAIALCDAKRVKVEMQGPYSREQEARNDGIDECIEEIRALRSAGDTGGQS